MGFINHHWPVAPVTTNACPPPGQLPFGNQTPRDPQGHTALHQDIELDHTPNDFAFTLHTSRLSPHPKVFTKADPPFEITHTNDAWTTLCGWKEHEAVGRTCAMLHGEKTSRLDKEIIANAVLRLQRSCITGITNYTRSGSQFSNNLVLEPLTSGGEEGRGRITHYVGTIFVTEAAALQYAQAAGIEASVGKKRSRCRLAAEDLARKGELSLHDVIWSIIPLLSRAKGQALRHLILRMLTCESQLDVQRFHICLKDMLGNEAAVLQYFMNCLQHYGTAYYCDP